jgi:hypothetical protein
LHTKSPLSQAQYAVARNVWWLGIWLRGLRYTNWTNVKPACFWFAEENFSSQQAINMRNAYAPVALYDKYYDDLGIDPYVTGLEPVGTLPVWIAGSTARRMLVVYNDEFRGTRVKIEVLVRSGSKVYSQGTAVYTVPLGEHLDIPYEFEIPYLQDEAAELVLRTYKSDQCKFEEIRRFSVGYKDDAKEPVPTSDLIRFSKPWGPPLPTGSDHE